MHSAVTIFYWRVLCRTSMYIKLVQISVLIYKQDRPIISCHCSFLTIFFHTFSLSPFSLHCNHYTLYIQLASLSLSFILISFLFIYTYVCLLFPFNWFSLHFFLDFINSYLFYFAPPHYSFLCFFQFLFAYGYYVNFLF